MGLNRNRLVLAKLESAYGVDPTPTGLANAILTSTDLSFDSLTGSRHERNNIDGTMGSQGVIVGALHATCSFSIELSGAGAAGDTPSYGCLLRACGFSETVTASTDVQYDPVSTGHESVTLYIYMDGEEHKITGARGNADFTLSANGIPSISFSFTGLRNDPTTVSNPTPDFTGFVSPIPVSEANTSTLTLFGYAAASESISISSGGDVQYVNLINQETVKYVDRKIGGSMSIEKPDLASKDYYAIAAAGTEGALQAIHGTVAGNIVQFDADKVQLESLTHGEISGSISQQFNLRLNKTSGDDEFKLTVK